MENFNNDSDEDIFNIPNYAEEAETNRVNQFREALASWKKMQLDSIIGDKQDNIVLNKYSRNSSDLYYALKQYIEEGKLIQLNNSELLNALGDVKTLTMDERIKILQSLFRDLIEFRFTYDINLIDQFNTNEKINTNIIPN